MLDLQTNDLWVDGKFSTLGGGSVPAWEECIRNRIGELQSAAGQGQALYN